jgi:trans-aconitate 2-methyltransferase
MSTSTWNPTQYNRFRTERQQPFLDLVALLEPRPHPHVVDLGCGTGEMTRLLHDRLPGADTLGLDSSEDDARRERRLRDDGPALRARRDQRVRPGGGVRRDSLQRALQWLPDHAELFGRLRRGLANGGQLAVQMPMNYDHPSHTIAAEVAGEAPFRDALGGFAISRPVQSPEWYATLLHTLGFARQHVRLQVYPHVLAARDEVIEWVRGTLLTAYERRLPPELWPPFMERYRTRLLPALADERPYFYAFKRLLIWAAE